MNGSEDVDDYMSMAIVEPTKPEKETSIQRQARRRREAELRARVKSKAEKKADDDAARDAALATSLDISNKGFRMMAKFGFKQGDTLGASKDARAEPINIVVKEDKGGIGLDAEKKRKFREEVEHVAKRAKAEEGEYRERMRSEREEKRKEGQLINAQKVAERLDTEVKEKGVPAEKTDQLPDRQGINCTSRRFTEPLNSTNILWRGLLRRRLEKEREGRMRYDLAQSRSRLPTYTDPDEDEDDRRALGKEEKSNVLEEELEEDDPQLEEFNALPVNERLEKLVLYLRDMHNYCFWCKYQYHDASMDGCPGVTEDEHD
ncbi:hypothetical protein AOQ84DRAFT_401588 [Glonium stellatum]|uniref:G-patch domain-containing protein n=1 Tax=Glonium stellatum TaxID=574774 RepID=A0A8E2ENN7_9PEZI|nr:hypothetical protein AOQ84DRAFT_401588 [Glonium stellatum]